MTLPNIVLFVLDAVRFDHLSAYGYSRRTSSVIDNVASQGCLFSQAIATAPWSLPSYASMLTGLYPTQHGATQTHPRLRLDIPTLAEELGKRGYRTIGLSNNPWVGETTGLNRGFDVFWEWKAFRSQKPETWTKSIWWRLKRAIGRLQGNYNEYVLSTQQTLTVAGSQTESALEQGHPFFLFVNIMAAHLPYSAPPRIRDRFLRNKKLCNLPRSMRNDASFITGQVSFSEAEWATLVDLYDGAIAYQDECLGEFLSDLRGLGVLDDTLLCVTADHGENLGDHGLLGHILCLYDSLLRVPLIIRWPGKIPAGMIYQNQVQNLDLFFTCLAAAQNQDSAVEPGNSRDLVACINGHVGENSSCFAFAEHFEPVIERNRLQKRCPGFDDPRLHTSLKCVRTADFKYIWSERTPHEFYDLRADPGETMNLFGQGHPSETELSGILQGWTHSMQLGQGAAPEPLTISEIADEEVLERLRALGYL